MDPDSHLKVEGHLLDPEMREEDGENSNKYDTDGQIKYILLYHNNAAQQPPSTDSVGVGNADATYNTTLVLQRLKNR